MKVLVLGVGKMGYGILKDLVKQSEVEEIVAADAYLEGARAIVGRVGSDKIKEVVKVDVRDKAATVKLIKGFDVVAGGIPRPFCDQAVEATIEAGVGWADIAANFGTIFSQHKAAVDAGVTVVPHIGLDVGTDRVLCGVGARKLDHVESFYVGCGGFPQKGTEGYNNPLRYKISWYWPFAVSSNLGSCKILRGGKTVEIPVLSEVNDITFPEPLGKLEAFTNGSLIDVVEHLGLSGVKDAYAQTIRWPGHSELWTTLKGLHLLDSEPVKVKGEEVSPMDLWLSLGEKYLQYNPGEGDAICQRVIVSGLKDEEPASWVYEFMDFYDPVEDITAMARTTGFPCSIVAQMIAKGEMDMPGVIHPALIGYDERLSELFFEEMARRDIMIMESHTAPFN
jgi:lysine 6-dehydrogenase